MGRAFVLVAALVAGLMLAAPAAHGQAGRLVATSNSESVRVPAGTFKRIFVNCPTARNARGPDVALAGSTAPPAGVRLASSVPGRKRWLFRFRNVLQRAQQVRALVRCLRVPVPRGVRTLRYRFLRRGRGVVLTPGQVRSVAVRCPSRFVPTGYGIRRTSGRLRLYGVVPSATDFRFGLQEIAGGPATAELFVRCLARRGTAISRAGGALVFPTGVKRRRFTDSVAAGVELVRHGCAFGDASVSTGFRHSPFGPPSLLGDRLEGHRRGRWLFLSSGTTPSPVRTFLVCLDGQTSFRPR